MEREAYLKYISLLAECFRSLGIFHYNFPYSFKVDTQRTLPWKCQSALISGLLFAKTFFFLQEYFKESLNSCHILVATASVDCSSKCKIGCYIYLT